MLKNLRNYAEKFRLDYMTAFQCWPLTLCQEGCHLSFYLKKPKVLEVLALFFFFIPAVICRHSTLTNIVSASLRQGDFVSVSILAFADTDCHPLVCF